MMVVTIKKVNEHSVIINNILIEKEEIRLMQKMILDFGLDIELPFEMMCNYINDLKIKLNAFLDWCLDKKTIKQEHYNILIKKIGGI